MSSVNNRLRSHRAGCLWVGMLTLLPLLLGAGKSPSSAGAALRLRLEWGGGAAEVWQGVLEVSQGTLSDPQSLGIEADEPASLGLQEGALWIQRRTARAYDGFDVTVTAPHDARLTFSLQTARGQTRRVEIPIHDLYDNAHISALGSPEQHLAIRRTPGSTLLVNLDRSHVIYHPGEAFAARVGVNLLETHPRSVVATIHWKLTPARESLILAEGSCRLSTTANSAEPPLMSLNLKAPEKEGVYDLHLKATGHGGSDIQRMLQFVVLATDRPEVESPSIAAERIVDEFAPTEAAEWRRVTAAKIIQTSGETSDQWLPAVPQEVPVGAAAPLHWSAFRLKLEHVGRPHRIAFTLPAHLAQGVGASLLQPNAAGQLMPVGLDLGFATDDTAGGEPARHQCLFWSQVHDPILLLHNVKSGRPLQVSHIQVFEIGESLPPRRDTPVASATPRRLVGPYLHKPLLSENFSAPEFYDRASRRSLDDWLTFLVAGNRLVEYLNSQAHNSLMLAVYADGSTLYPSTCLQPSPRYDTGLFASTGQDPVRKDVLELLFQLFDREQLALVPELQFSAPLPELEQQAAAGTADSVGIRLIGRTGATWMDSYGSVRGLGAYYNPLDSRVQQAMLKVVREVVERYRQHPSFRGLSLELTDLGFLQLPGLDWGLDDRTIARFEKATGIKVPGDDSPERFEQRADFLLSRGSREWTAWRCQELARFHLQIVTMVTEIDPSLQVFLSGHRLLRSELGSEETQHAFRTGVGLEQIFASRGLDFTLYADEPRLTVLRPTIAGSVEHSLPQLVFETLNNSPSVDSAYGGGSRGGLMYITPTECRIPEFDSLSPWQPAYTWLAAHVLPPRTTMRQSYAHALAALDAQAMFCGGWMLPLGQETETAGLRQAIGSLPAVRFQPLARQVQPVVVRTAQIDGRTCVYAVNDSSLPLQLTLYFNCNAQTGCRDLGRDEPLPLHSQGARASSLTVKLEGNGIWCGELAEPVEVQKSTVVLQEAALVHLQKRIDQLHKRMTRLGRHASTSSASMSNPGFELVDAEQQVPGWDLSVQNADLWTLDRKNPHSGRTALRLAGPSGQTALVSRELKLADSRCLTMTLWMRSGQANLPVQMSVEGQLEGEPYRQQGLIRIDSQWRRYVFRVKHLPGERLQSPRIRLELQAQGQLWVDDVEVSTQWLTPEDMRQLTKTVSGIRLAWDERRYADCQRLLESYWGQFVFFEEGQPSTVAPDSTARGQRVKALLQR